MKLEGGQCDPIRRYDNEFDKTTREILARKFKQYNSWKQIDGFIM
jgi:hypothetical protein